MDFTPFIKYGEIGAIIALIALVYWVIKTFMSFISEKDKRDQEAYCKLGDTIDKNTEITKEMATYLRYRNGNDNKAIRDEVKKIMKEG